MRVRGAGNDSGRHQANRAIHGALVHHQPADDARIQVNRETVVRGIAFDGGQGIAEVAFSSNGGSTWQAARLDTSHGRYSFHEWTARFTPTQKGCAPIEGARNEPQRRDTAAHAALESSRLHAQCRRNGEGGRGMRSVIPAVMATAIAATATLPAGQQRTVTLPPETAVYVASDLPGYQLVQKNCVGCHSAHYVAMQPPGSGAPGGMRR